ncbi:hypothetical protein JOC86_004100 [Bacillus pakistanensis]|uniref:VWFA domain-containing protein n=1 Tax=Rossellomorea pakistanensis TaxID=992288 RepID=A0ABS2NI43_9BACI|nr:VWA domain-containing protein [Bacillus pakistanensis]MBM7587527.1 hypothetical protein [Bacillus pakistanensis]
MKRLSFILLSILLVILSACGNDSKNANTDASEKKKKESKSTEAVVGDLDKINLEVSLDSLKSQPAGTLMEHLTFEEDVKEVNHQAPELDPELKKVLPEKLKALTDSTKDLEELKKSLLKLLASPHYKEVIEKAERYEPPFEEPYLPDPTKSTDGKKTESPQKAIILLDASSSMLLNSGGRMKMDIAKDAVKSFAQTIGQSSDVSLVVYGHKGSEADSDKELSCKGMEEVYPMGKYVKEDFHKAVDSFESKGWTPLAGAIQKASEMSSNYDKGTTIYVVSDGAETCDGDPVQASKQLAKNGKNTVNIIGFDVDAKTENQLKDVAAAGNGKYFSANNPEELKNTIQYEWLPSTMDLTWAFTMAPIGFEVSNEFKNAEEFPRKLWYISRRELFRLDDAFSIMKEKKMLTDKQLEKLENWRMDRHDELLELSREMEEINRNKTKAQADEISKKIEDWVEKMKKLKEERGDKW